MFLFVPKDGLGRTLLIYQIYSQSLFTQLCKADDSHFFI